jgi:hypothetical protein
VKFYRVTADCDGMPYCATLAEAKQAARYYATTSYHDIDVEQVEIATDRANILRLLNTSGGTDVSVGTVYTAKGKLKS